MPEIITRFLKKEDAISVAVLIPQLTKNIVEPENLEQRIADLTKPGNWQYFVAEKDRRVIGFAGLAWYVIPSKGLVGWIEEVVVDKQFRGQWVGHQLLERLTRFAKSKKIVQLKLTASDPIAIHLYEIFLFTKKDEYLMVRKCY